MIRRRVPIARVSAKRGRKSGPRAALFLECSRLWSAAVLRKNGGRCIAIDWPDHVCSGPMDPAHCFPKGACPAVRFDPDFGEPLCRSAHQRLANGATWRALLCERWGPALYRARYIAAHQARVKLDMHEVRRTLLEAA